VVWVMGRRGGGGRRCEGEGGVRRLKPKT